MASLGLPFENEKKMFPEPPDQSERRGELMCRPSKRPARTIPSSLSFSAAESHLKLLSMLFRWQKQSNPQHESSLPDTPGEY